MALLQWKDGLHTATATMERALHASSACLQKALLPLAHKIADHPYLVAPFALSGFFSIASYLCPLLWQNLVLDCFPVNLKKKYNAEWALVTGASSGQDLPDATCCSQIKASGKRLLKSSAAKD
jgi:hypothetical protein